MLSISYLWHTVHNIRRNRLQHTEVVICFQYLIFDILYTTNPDFKPLLTKLWFAFNILSLTYCTQRYQQPEYLPVVVICFQYLIFDILYTTTDNGKETSSPLWFAFNILSLTYCTQRGLRKCSWGLCCDLLSISYLWHTVHNFTPFDGTIELVVICFQYLIFDILYTTTSFKQALYFKLWFAFNILSLTYCTQHNPFPLFLTQSCDLLSISYLWHTVHNLGNIICSPSTVVICFQYLIFDILYTTFANIALFKTPLWFAFNILSLTYCTQQKELGYIIFLSCDLLSISYLWHTVHNWSLIISFKLESYTCCFE